MVQQTLLAYRGWGSPFLETKSQRARVARAKSAVPWIDTTFRKLPRELREEIYRYYFEVPGGYAVNPSTNKLRTADGNPIDLSLGSVCLELRAETMGKTFELNAVHATTTSPESNFRTSAERWSKAVRLNHLLDREILFAARSLITENILDDILDNFPEYDMVLENLMRGDFFRCASGAMMSANEGPSTERQFLRYALNLIQRQPGFGATVGADLLQSRITAMLNGSSDLDYWRMDIEPGSIPDPDHLSRLETTTAGYTSKSYSAAAVMIRFLARHIQHPMFMQIRQVHLHEDRPSAASPECHAEPFVNFLAINPHLKVHRRVSLWRNLWASVYKERTLGGFYVHDLLSQIIYRWIVEAEQIIDSVGRDRKVFSLEFDCDSMADLAKEMFDVVQQDAAWQFARGNSLQNGSFQGDAHDLDRHIGLLWDPYGMLDGKLLRMRKATSLLRCNFDYGMDSGLHESILVNDWSQLEWGDFWEWQRSRHTQWEEMWRAQSGGESFGDPIILD